MAKPEAGIRAKTRREIDLVSFTVASGNVVTCSQPWILGEIFKIRRGPPSEGFRGGLEGAAPASSEGCKDKGGASGREEIAGVCAGILSTESGRLLCLSSLASDPGSCLRPD